MPSLKTSRTAALADAIRQQILNGRLPEGARLPSIRLSAKQHAVAPSTAVEAYDRLVAEGLLISRRGSGFYVARSRPAVRLISETRAEGLPDDPLWVSHQALESSLAAMDESSQLLSAGSGWLPFDWLPQAALAKSLRAVTRQNESLLCSYSGSRGSQALREYLQGRLGQEGIQTDIRQIMLTSSGTQALDLVCRLLLCPGDTVLVDDPCYFNFRALLSVHRVTVVGVPYTPDGPDSERFEQLVTQYSPRMYITNSGLHNPTGAMLSHQTAFKVLSVANARQMIVVEDDIFADFCPEPGASLAQLDGLENVIRIGSFSKTLSASLRCGYIAAPSHWADRLLDLQIATQFGGPGLLISEAIAGLLTGGSYRKYLDDIRRRLDRLRPQVVVRLQALGFEPWLVPGGGFNLWCRMPEGIDAVRLAQIAREHRLMLAPDGVFSVSRSTQQFMRFNIAHLHNPQVFAALEQGIKSYRAAAD